MNLVCHSFTLLTAAGFATIFAAAVQPNAAFAQSEMPPGTRQWIELSSNNIDPCICDDDSIGFVAAMPSPSPNYIRDPAQVANGRFITAEAASTATSMQASYRINFVETVFLYNSFVDTYTIVGPPGTSGQIVAASVTMTTTGELRVDRTTPTAAFGASYMTLEIGTWRANAVTDQFRVNALAANTRRRSIQLVNHPAPVRLPINEILTASFTPVVGTPFDVAFGYELSGSGADIASTIVWNLPPGYSITSVLGYNAGSACDSIDFNNNGVFPEDQDVVDFFDVLAGGACGACNDVDFNNNGVFPEDQDVVDFFNILAGGTCP